MSKCIQCHTGKILNAKLNCTVKKFVVYMLPEKDYEIECYNADRG